MKKLLTNKWIQLLIAVVVLYLVWKRYGKKSTPATNGGETGVIEDVEPMPRPTPTPDQEEKANLDGMGSTNMGCSTRSVGFGIDDEFSRHADNF